MSKLWHKQSLDYDSVSGRTAVPPTQPDTLQQPPVFRAYLSRDLRLVCQDGFFFTLLRPGSGNPLLHLTSLTINR